MAKHWAELEESTTIVGIKILLGIYRLLGRIPFLLVLIPVVLYYYLFNKQARDSSLDFLKRIKAQPGVNLETSLTTASFRHFLNFAQTLLDKLIVWMGAITQDDIIFDDKPEFVRLLDEKQGAVIIGSHLGNLEVLRALSTQRAGVMLNILVHTKHAEKFNRLLKKADEFSQLRMIQVTEINPATAIMLQDKVHRGEFIVIMGDRVPVAARAGKQGVRVSRVDFLGEKAAFPQGPLLIASLLKCPVYTLFCIKQEKKYLIDFKLFSNRIVLKRKQREQDLVTHIQDYANVLEDMAIKHPLHWYNFFSFWA